MPTIVSPPPEVREQRVVMKQVSWETYERLLAANMDASSPRLTYNQGTLEIMSPSVEHERLKKVLATIADLVAEEQGREFEDLGSTTFRRRDFEGGAEPDACFYLQNVEHIRRKQEIDLAVDPPPDLVIEVEISSPAVSKLSIYARLGVPEIWLTDGQSVRILRLADGQYKSSEKSEVLPPLTELVLSEFLRQSKTLTTLAWRRVVRDWAGQRSR
jgi:Uma2 family endonuclease